jgi:hypothetical protein
MPILIFKNVHKVMKADTLCRQRGISCRVLPVPEHISSECGMCLEVEAENTEKCTVVLKENNIQFEIYNMEVL